MDMIRKGTKPTEPLASVTHTWNGKRRVECELIGDKDAPLFQVRVNGHSIALDKAQWARVRLAGDNFLGDVSGL